jgi:hypothetical protein
LSGNLARAPSVLNTGIFHVEVGVGPGAAASARVRPGFGNGGLPAAFGVPIGLHHE